MAKTPLTPEEKAAQASAKKAAQEANAKECGMNERVKKVFEEYPLTDRLYSDGEELFFSQTKPEMSVYKRADFLNKTTND